MEHKNKSFSRIKRHQSDKVLRYSIRKYSFGAASVAVAALMFLGTHAVSADAVDTQNQPTIGAPNPNEEEAPLIEPAPTSKNEEIKETEKVEVAKETEEREKPSENKEAVEANSLNNGTSTSAIIATKDASADKVTEKQRLDKSQLQASITKVQELLAKVNKEKAPASTLAAIQADLERANSVLNNDSLELTQAEVDAAAKKLSDKLFVLSSMPKLVAPKIGTDTTPETPKTEAEIKHSLETVKEDLQKYVKKSEITTDKPNVTAAEEILENISKQLENTTLTSKELTALLEQAKTVRNSLVNEELRATSGAHDSRNNRSMGEGVNFRADGVNVEGALYDVKEYISEPARQGSTVEGNRTRTTEKIFMTAKYSKEGNRKYITYDVYFHNDGEALGGNFVGDAFWFYPPRDLLYNVGRSYPVGVVSDAYYERYEKKAGATGTLSHNSNNFTRVGERYTVPLERLASNSYQDSGSQGLWGNAGGLFQMSGGPTRDEQRQQMLKKLENNEDLNRIIRLNNNPKGPYPSGSYSHILTISKGQNFAYKYHVKMRLKDDVTAEQARTAGAMAVSAKAGAGTTAYEAYVYAARGTRLVTKPDAQIDPIQGLTVTKTVGDTLGDPNDPANSGYVRHKENKSFPGGMTWSWQNGVKPTSTAKAGVFKYKVIATYQDGTTSEDKGSGSDGTVTLIVRPTAPTITTAPQYSGTLVSTDRVISGTGAAGATVKVTLQDGTTGTTTVNNQGKWTYTLKANEKLTQNTKSDATIKADNAISVTQTQNGAESEASTVNVQLAKAISIDTPVQAGREITVSVAHDTGRFYVQVYNNRNDQRAAYEYGVKQENGRWVLETGSDKTDLVEVNTNNVSDKKFTLRIKDANKKTNFPFKITANSVVKVRSHHINNKNNPANPANDPDGGWVTASPATNTNPTITVKAPNTRNYTADGSLTMAGLKNLVTVADAEDDANKTVGNTVSDNLNVTIRKGNETVTLSGNEYLKKGDYTLTYTTTDAAGVRVEKTHTITVSSLAESKGTSITYPVDTAKVVYGNSDVTNGNFTPAIKQTFANKLTEVNRGNNNLPTINGTGVTFAPGTTNDKAKVVVATFPDGSTLDISHDKVAKPAAPTITPSANFEGDLGSTERSISGTGIAGATVKIALQDGKTGEATVGSDGRWTYNLKAGETLKQNYKQDATTKATSPVSVKQVANGIESAATTANVRLGYVISFDTPVQAGRDITVRVPHDGAKFYVVIAGKEGRYEYGLTKTASGWQLTEPNGATTTEVTEEAGANASEKVVKLHIKDSNKKTNIPYTIPSATRSIMARMHYDNSAGNPSGGWVFAPDATNTNPTITVKAPNTRNYTADGSLTMAGLKNLVTVGDAEDDANKTVGNTVSDNLNVTIRKGNETVTLSGNEYLKKGEYTLTYTTTDAAGVSVTKEHTITVSSLAESKGTSITYPVDTAKVVYGNSDVTNGNFTPAIKQTFANKLTEVNRGNNNLPTINGTGVTFAPGTTNDKAKVVVATFPDGSTLDISHDKVAKPAAPTITPSANFEGDLGSTERSISGTGIAGATVKIALQDGKTGEATVGSDGRWTYNLKAGETLKQNYKQDATTKATSPVSVKQVANGIESAATTANVRLGYVISFDTPVQAGRDITVRVPHDGAKFYVVIAGKEGRYEYGLTKTASGWQLTEPNGATTTEVTEEAGANASEKVVKLHIKDSNKKTNIPYTIPSATRSIMARMHYDNSAGNPSGGWVFAPDATNTNPTITVKAPNTRNYTADGSLTMAGLKNLVTVADAEDDANKTVGNTVSDNLNVTIRKGNETVTLSGNEYLKKGDYTLTYTTTDAAGVRVEKTHNITVSSIPEVSIKAAKDATAQGIVPTTESNKVINSVTIPSNQPQPISKVLKDNGRITEVDGEKVATVVLTYSDNSTKEVTVPVLEVKPIDIVTTFNEKDNTVTIKPNTTVEINDRLQFGIRGKSMALTKTASGYTNSVNDRTITVNQDGSITITLVGEEKFQAGDRIVTRHESNKNGKVDSYETEAFSGLKPVEKVPVINLTNLTPKEKEDVKAAVKKANPSVNTAELEVAANGDVTYRHKGAGVGTSDPTPEIRLNGNVIKKPSVPEIKTSLEGKANTNTPVEVEVKSDAGTTVKLYDVTGKEIGSATADSNGTARITVSEKIPVGNVTAKAVSPEGVNSELSAPKKATDTTKPNAPEITSDLTGKANTNSPVTVSVKAEPGSTVKLYDKDNHEIGTGTAGDDGVATITVANNIPVGDVTAKATDASGNVSDPSAPKGATDTTKPNAPEITSDLTGKANTNSPVTVSVKAEPGSTVKLYDKDNHEIGTGTAGDDGVATITVANNIPVGDVTAKATDASGNVSDPSAPKGATDTTKPNAPEITSDLTGKANTNSPVTVSVKAEPGSTVKLYDKDNHEIGTGTAGDDGVATITVANNIPVGDVTAKATDASGNVSDPSAPKGATDTTKPNAPEITSDLTGKANTNSPVTVSVKAEPGSTVKLYDKDNHEIGTGTAGDDGVATITVANNIPVGDVTAKATDASGNVSDPSAPKGATDTTKPNAPEITSDLTGKANTNSPVTVSVKAEPGSTVKLYDKDNHEIGTGTAGDDGVATITVANNIPVGDVTAKATDASGNVSDPSAPKGATDTTKPNAPEITSDLTGKANTNSPVTVSVKAEPGSTVKLYDKDNHEIGTGTAGDDGVATITVANNIPVGDVTAKATDASGNVSDPSAPKGATDTTKPNAPEITSDLTGKANTNSPVTVSVKAEPGSTVKLYDKDNHEIGTGTAGDDGVATITVANNIPVGDVTAKATDASGNVSDPSAPKGATDTTKPNAPEITSDLTGKANTNSPVTVSVKAEPGSTVKLYDKDNHEIGTGTAGDDGVATITVANNIPVGDVTAKATDASGNVSDPSAPKGATDTTKPNAPEITSDLTGKANTNSPVTVSVKAEPGSTVKLYDKDNHEIGTGTAGDDGVATITVANNIPVGDVTAKATDASGNVSDPSAPKGATDTTKPNAPEITSDLTGKANTNSPVTVSVKAEPGSTVKLYDKDNHEIGTGTAGDDGVATITVANNIPVGDVTAKATDASGNVSDPSAPKGATDTTKPNAPEITSDLTGKANTNSPVTVSVKAEPGSTVKLYDKDNHEIGTGTAGDDGVATITVANNIPVGDVTAKATDASGNVSDPSAPKGATDTTKPNAPEITSDLTGKANTNSPVTVSVKAEPGSTVKLYDKDNHEIGTGTAGDDGVATITVANNIPVGDVTAKATDASGNVSDPSAPKGATDTTKPNAPEITSDLTGKANTNSPVTVSVKAEPGSTVKLYDKDNHEIGTGTAGDDGVATITVANNIPVGDVTAKATDASGNVSDPSAPKGATDTTKPNAPEITSDLTGKANTNSPVTVSVKAEPGSTVKLYDKDNHEIGTGTAGDDGVATITVANNIPVGDVTAKATDASGNVSDPSAPKGATDTTKPNAPEITSDLTGKANTNSPVTVSVKAEPGSTVKLYDKDNHEIGTGTAGDDGVATITVANNIPVGDVTAKATDASGNVSDPSAPKGATDTTKPNAPEITSDLTGKANTNSPVTVSVKAEPGSTVKLYDKDNHEIGTGTAGDDGVATITVANNIPVGDVTAKATDASGNVSDPSAPKGATDTTKPNAPEITSDLTGKANTNSPVTVSVKAEPGSTVKLYDKDNHEIGTGTAGDDGVATITVANNIPVGDVTAKATDASGNVSDPSAPKGATDTTKPNAPEITSDLTGKANTNSPVTVSVKAEPGSTVKLYDKDNHEIGTGTAGDDGVATITVANNIPVGDVTAKATDASGNVSDPSAPKGATDTTKPNAPEITSDLTGKANTNSPVTVSVKAEPGSTVKLYDKDNHEIGTGTAGDDGVATITVANNIPVGDVTAKATDASGNVSDPSAPKGATDTTKPNAPEITSDLTGKANTNSPVTVSVKAEPGSTVKLYDKDNHEIGTGTAGDDGVATITVANNIPVGDVTAKATDASGNVSDPSAPKGATDTTKPNAPEITSDLTGKANTNSPVTVSVKAEPGSTVKLYDKDNHEIGTGTAGDDGVATITVANNIPVGDVTAKATDASGNVSDPSAPKGATDTTKPNAPEITSDLTGKANTNSPVTVSVKAEPGSTVKLYDKDNHEIGTGTAGDDGVATITVANNIPVGDVTAKATDASGNVSDPSAPKGATDTTKPNAPEITSDLTGKANTNSPVTVSVKAEPGSTVKLYDKDNHEIGTGTAGDDGVATITVANNIPVGDVTAKATDASGNVSDPSAPKGATDTTKPNAPEITSDLTGKANTNSPVTVSVKAEPGSTVKLYDKDNHEIGTGTAGDDGVATITVANNIPVGDVTAKATDASGNVSDPSAPKGATDTTKPNAPEITSDLTGKANTNSPVTVSVKAEPGSTVKLYDKDNHEIGTGTAGDDGVATITVANNIPVGDVTAKATDASGNVSDPSAPKGATDTTKPNAPEITSDLTGKANTNSPVTVSVKAEPGSTVKLYDKDNHEIGTGTAGDDGVATITVANNIPVGDVTAKATDASGNVSDPSAPKGATDTTKPNAPEITSDLTGKANTNSPVTVSVKAEPGSTVKLYDKDNHEIGTGTAGDDGVATITVANNIPVGDVTAKATDASGNVSDPSAPKGATDTTKPNAPEITSDLTGKANTNSPVTVSVKAEPGSTVKLYDKDNHEIGTGTAGDDGVATITVANNIPVGDVTAKATDASGNVSDPSAPKGATDTTKPNAPEITSDLTGKANTNSPVTVSVKAEPGSTVKLYDKDNHEIGTGTAGDDGVATITVANNIPVGDVTAKATDASGNVSDPSAPKGATDTTKPNAPEITSDLTGKANTNSPVTVSVKAEPGSTVKLYDKDNHEIGTGTAGDDGVATITVANNIPVGDVTAKATDASGNVSDPSAPKGATDTTKPNAPEITSDLTGKANTNSPVTVSVKAEPGSTVKLYDKDNHEIGTGTAGDDGVATITVANNIPVGDVTAKATDASGNVSDPSAPKGATDTTKPNAPEITSDLTGKANTNSPVTVSVKAEPGSTVKLYDKDNHEIGTGTAGDDGVATITVANNIPVGDVTAKATDASGNVSDPSAPKGATDTTKPNAPEITSDLTGKANTNSPVTVSVKAEPGSTVKLYDKDNHEIGTGTAGDDGVATITVANNIPVGDVTAKATDASGNVSDPSAPKGATDTTKPNAPEITSDLTGKANTNSPVTVSVKAEPGSTVKLYDKDNHEIGTGTAGDDGVATITVANNIPVGDVTAKATDASGNVSDPSAPKGATDTTKPNAPEITSDLTGKANTNSPVTVSVKAEPGSTVKLYDKDNHEIGTGTAGDDGVATITVANNIPVGDVTAKATDASGNVSDPSAPKGATDTTKPNAPEITSDLTGKANTNSPVTVSVKAEPGSTVKLYDKDNHEIGTGTAGDDGVATITVANNIPVGDVTAKATDASGNVSDPSAPKGATDTTKPNAPEITSDLTGKANTNSPVTVSVKAEPGSTVKLYDKDNHEIGTGTAGDDGVATITVANNIPVGDVTAKATDASGNVSDPSAPKGATDTTKPNAPEITSDLTGKANTNSPVTVSVKAEPGSTVKLYDKDNHEIGTGTAGDDGVATITVANNIPVGDVTAKATDASGNVSDPSAPKGATDTTKPNAPEITSDLTGKANTNSPVTVSVKAEPGSTVKLYDKDNHEIGTGTAGDDGVATITVANNIPVGDVTAKATDASGNVSDPSAPKGATDTTKPNAPEITSDLTGKANTNSPVTVSVKAEPGSTVKLYDKDNHEIGTGTAGDDGVATITVANNIPVGDVTAKATDASGNVSDPSAPKGATDTTKPNAPEITSDLTGKANTNSPVTVSVKAEPGSTVKLYDKDNHEIGTGTAGDDGVATITVANNIPVGDVTAKATDASGNVSDPSAPKGATDTTKPNAPEIQPELPEFNGGVNGELPDPLELPKVKLIITKWIDEQGNELKPADAKAPAVLGEANEAFEHGEIEGYVFVRTDVNEEGDVVTHVFRKVTTTKPEGNGEQQGGDNTPQSTPEVPTDNTERKPETEKPTVPDTKQAEQLTQTVDAQVAPSQNQAVLPNTGTKADRATGALGALSLLGAFGLLFAKKKKDDEEETRNN